MAKHKCDICGELARVVYEHPTDPTIKRYICRSPICQIDTQRNVATDFYKFHRNIRAI